MRKIKENFGETIKPTLVKYNVLVSPLPVCGIEIKAETETDFRLVIYCLSGGVTTLLFT